MARHLTPDHPIAKLGDRFEEMINAGTINWRKVSRSSLRGFGPVLLEELDQLGVQWWLGPSIGTAYVIKIDDDMLRYLDVFPDAKMFMWCGEGHHDGIHPDVAWRRIAQLMINRPGPHLN